MRSWVGLSGRLMNEQDARLTALEAENARLRAKLALYESVIPHMKVIVETAAQQLMTLAELAEQKFRELEPPDQG